ncbi:IclR family transcriptional regulator domain-containing protein [Glycomyces tenuis]|uniref:IclR family transcriptional regulator domain-containing protein n=1 Tax=Glycomyces tenuis TaxID=58116 RepID=UPI0005589EB9|nr:IclR family transcriptional regulator C-terminal domain-containing protein [Glycomyces tenuis]
MATPDPQPPEVPRTRLKQDRHWVRASSLTLDILGNLVRQPGLTVSEIASRLRRSATEDTVRDHLKTMMGDGFVTRRKWRYYLDPNSPLGGSPGSHDRESLVLTLIDRLSRYPMGATATELAVEVGVPKETLLNLISSVMDAEWAYRDASGRFRLDLKALTGTVPFDITASELLVQECSYQLRDLKASVFLASFDDEDSMQIVAHGEAPGVLYMDDIADGLSTSAHSSALGRALTSTFTLTERARYFKERGMKRFTRETVRAFDDLEQALSEAARKRIYVEHGETIPDIHCTAVLARNGVLRGDRFALAVALRDAPTEAQEVHVVNALKACVADLAPVLMAQRPPPTMSQGGTASAYEDTVSCLPSRTLKPAPAGHALTRAEPSRPTSASG